MGEDDDRPWDPLASGPPTIEEQISPFHVESSPKRTLQGMPQVHFPTPRVASTEQVAVLRPPSVIQVPPAVPSSIEALPPDGPTVPDGLPSLMGAPAPSSGEATFDELATDPFAGAKLKGTVPAPDAPKVQISKSMEYDVASLRDLRPEDKTAEVKAPRAMQPPTEVLLPALKRQEAAKKEDRSEGLLVVGLLVLVLLILGLLAAVVVGILQRM